MNTPIRTILMLITLLAVALLVTACGAATASPAAPTQTQIAQPTTDLNPLRTEVAATVLAQVPQICAMTPSATLQPTATHTRVVETSTITPTQPTQTPGAGTPTVETNDKAAWISQSIPDGSTFEPGADFTITWRIQNVGTSTWTAGYRLRFFAGQAFGSPDEIELGKEVLPGEMVDIPLNLKAPRTSGEYRGDWVMSNEARGNFKEPLYLMIVVPAPTATPTRTVVPTNTATVAEPSATPTN